MNQNNLKIKEYYADGCCDTEGKHGTISQPGALIPLGCVISRQAHS
jgi:hypothetical protein